MAVCTWPPAAEKTVVAIKKFDHRFLDVVTPLMTRFEREVFEASFRFSLRHPGADHSVRNIGCEGPGASLCG